jgi:large subunit ribosomal protein L1
VRVLVFARGAAAAEAVAAGAALVGGEELVDSLARGATALAFDVTVASPELMPAVGRVARLLGPRGLMPNPKLGTVTPAVGAAVAAARRGQAEFRAEKRGIVHAAIGKASFAPAALRDNLRALLLAVGDARPEGLKGAYLRSATLRSTMGAGLPLDVRFCDPQSALFMRTQEALDAEAALAAAAAK